MGPIKETKSRLLKRKKTTNNSRVSRVNELLLLYLFIYSLIYSYFIYSTDIDKFDNLSYDAIHSIAESGYPAPCSVPLH